MTEAELKMFLLFFPVEEGTLWLAGKTSGKSSKSTTRKSIANGIRGIAGTSATDTQLAPSQQAWSVGEESPFRVHRNNLRLNERRDAPVD